MSRKIRGAEEHCVTCKGIQLYRLWYNSSELAALRSSLENRRARVKVDQKDIGSVRVWDPTEEHWLDVPAVNRMYARGLTLSKHLKTMAEIRRFEHGVIAPASQEEGYAIPRMHPFGHELLPGLHRWVPSSYPFPDMEPPQLCIVAPRNARSPMIRIVCPVPVALRSLAFALLAALGEPPRHRESMFDKNGRLVRMLQAHQVQIVVIDRADELIDEDQAELRKWLLSWFSTLRKQTGAVFLLRSSACLSGALLG